MPLLKLGDHYLKHFYHYQISNRNEPDDEIETTRHSFFDSLWEFLAWACDQLKPITGQSKTRHLNELYTWARDTVMWHW